MSAALHPFQLLQQIEERSRTRALGLPQQIEVRRSWSGIGFRMGNTHLLTEMNEVEEILEYPDMTRVPSAMSWVKGIANVRGVLVPILDLRDFIDGQKARMSKKTRVLRIRHGDLFSGLIVDEVFGMRHFFYEEKTQQLPDVSIKMKNFLDGGYRRADSHWGIFSMKNLASDSKYVEVLSR